MTFLQRSERPVSKHGGDRRPRAPHLSLVVTVRFTKKIGVRAATDEDILSRESPATIPLYPPPPRRRLFPSLSAIGAQFRSLEMRNYRLNRGIVVYWTR